MEIEEKEMLFCLIETVSDGVDEHRYRKNNETGPDQI